MKFHALALSLSLLTINTVYAEESKITHIFGTQYENIEHLNTMYDSEEFFKKKQAEYNNYKIENLLSIQDSYEIYNKNGLKIKAVRDKNSHSLSKDGYISVMGNLNFYIGDIYDATSIVNNPTNKSSWKIIKGVDHLGTLRISGIMVKDLNFNNQIDNIKPDGNTVSRNLIHYINKDNVKYADNYTSSLNYSSNASNQLKSLSTKVSIPKVSVEADILKKSYTEQQEYEFNISNMLYEVTYEIDKISASILNKKNVLDKLAPSKSPVYISKIKYGYNANLKINSVFTKDDLELALKGNYKAVEAKAQYKDADKKVTISFDTATHGIRPTESIMTVNLDKLAESIKKFEDSLLTSAQKEMDAGRPIGNPLEVEFKYISDNSPFNIGKVLNHSVLDYSFEIEGVKEYKPYIQAVKGKNVRWGHFSYDNVTVNTNVVFDIDTKSLESELKSIPNQNISAPNYSQVSKTLEFQKAGNAISNRLKSSLEELEKNYRMIQGGFTHFISIDDYKNINYPSKASERDVAKFGLLLRYPVFGEFTDISIQPVIRCTNTIQSCEQHKGFTPQTPKPNQIHIFDNNEARITIKWLQL